MAASFVWSFYFSDSSLLISGISQLTPIILYSPSTNSFVGNGSPPMLPAIPIRPGWSGTTGSLFCLCPALTAGRRRTFIRWTFSRLCRHFFFFTRSTDTTGTAIVTVFTIVTWCTGVAGGISVTGLYFLPVYRRVFPFFYKEKQTQEWEE